MASELATGIAVGGELLLTIFQAYMIAAKQQGMTAEQAKAKFLADYDGFMAASEKPVEAVKE
jgi:hypothetical protein